MPNEKLNLRSEADKRADYFATGNITSAEMEKYENIFDEPENTEQSWGYVDKKIKNGDVPPIRPDLVSEEDVYDAGSSDGCPVTDMLLYEYKLDPAELTNLYLSRNEMHRTISGLLKEVGNVELLDLWKGDEARKPGEERVDYAVAGTPTSVIEKGNPHMGVAKYENFAICQLFRRLKDAENDVNGPVADLPKKVKLYPNIDKFRDDAKNATSLNDLNEKFVSRLLPKMLEGGVTKQQAVELLIECFLSEPMLIEDNCWDRASKATNELADVLFKSEDSDKQEIGSMLKVKIVSRILALKD